MLIQDWMAKNVMTVDENTSLMRATRIMKENNIRRLPVVSHGKLIGIITDRDVKDASPSKTTSLDIHELYYLLSEMKVKDVMTSAPLTLCGNETLEKAAIIMLNSRISGLPVVDDSGHLIGLLSETDVLRGFIHMTGIKENAIQYVFDLPDQPGAVTTVTNILKENQARIISILTSFEDASDKMKRVAIRIAPLDDAREKELSELLKEKYKIVYYGRDDLTSLPKRTV
jgi:acetoin utilization protein AcuB